MVQYPMDEKHPAKEETSVKTGTRPRIGIIRQVAVFFALSVILTGIFYHLTQRRLTSTAIRKQTESLAGRISAEVKMAVMEYPAYQWMIGYWHNHYAEMDIEYDDIYAPGTVTWQKYARLRDHQPDLILKYARAETFSALPEEDKKLSAEIIYSWLVTRLNQIMQAHKPAYLYCAMTGEPYDSLFFLFSAAQPGAVRGTGDTDIFTLGHTIPVGKAQQAVLRGVRENASHLVRAGDYVDYYAYMDTIGEYTVLVGMTYDLTGLNASVDQQTARDTTFTMAFQVVLSMICLAMISFFVLQPLRKVQRNIRLYRQNKDSAAVIEDLSRIRSSNEIGQLALDVTDLSKEIDDYTAHIQAITAERERIGTELDLASRIQSSMLPDKFPPFPDRKEFDIYAEMDPAKEVGGDFYDFFMIDNDHLGLVIADVSGKGVPAALFMMISKIILAHNAKKGRTPAQVLADTNEAICANNQVMMFVTVWFGVLEISTGTLRAANAGHEYPMLRRPGGEFEIVKDKHGFVLGGMEGVTFTDYEITLEPGAKLFVYTDGLTEANDNGKNMFGTDRVLEALNSDPGASPKDTLDTVRRRVDDFVGTAEQFDDLTMMCLNYAGPAREDEKTK